MADGGAGRRVRQSGGVRSAYDTVAREIADMAAYWGERKADWLDAAAEEFDELVEPFTFHRLEATRREIHGVNGLFTEWALFEWNMLDGKTPLERYIELRPGGVGAQTLERLQQIARTHLYSRFAILGKDRGSGMVRLADTRTACSFEVCDPRVCAIDRWSDGTVAARIAQVDGMWQTISQVHLYDVARPEDTAVDGPGAVHPEDAGRAPDTADMSFFVRMLRDTIGMSGRYASTLRLRTVPAS